MILKDRTIRIARPSKDGVPVRPDKLDHHRYTHFFKGPCCLCSYKNGPTNFSEAKMGLSQTIFQPGTARCVGEYIAICATQECDYFGKQPPSPRSRVISNEWIL